MGTRADQPAPEVTDAEIEELLDAPETPSEKAALDELVSDPEESLKRALAWNEMRGLDPIKVR